MSLYVDIEKKYPGFDLAVKLKSGDEVLALLGASGCGKTLTLKMIAGIETPDKGKIILNGRTLFDSEKKINLSVQDRNVGMVFQNYALFPNMTVKQNILAATRRHKAPDCMKLVEKYIHEFELDLVADKYPEQISGGEKQRCALARTLVSKPEILMLDEPFSALDTHLKFKMEQFVRGVLADFDKPVILVSHNRDEVFRMSERIALFGKGHVDAIGSKHDIFADPVTRMGAALTGCKNVARASVYDRGPVLTRVDVPEWGLRLAIPSDIKRNPDFIGIRMHSILANTEDISENEDRANAFVCEIIEEVENPFSFTLMIRPQGSNATCIGWEVSKEYWNKHRAEMVSVHIPPENILVLEDK